VRGPDFLLRHRECRGSKPGETVSVSAATAFGATGGSALLRLRVTVDWIESAVTFNILVSQQYLVVKAPGEAGFVAGNDVQGGELQQRRPQSFLDYPSLESSILYLE